jgi:hypothetical protein
MMTWSRMRWIDYRTDAFAVRFDDRGHLLAGPLQLAWALTRNPSVVAVPIFDGTNYRAVIANGLTPLSIVPLDSHTFDCECVSQVLDLPLPALHAFGLDSLDAVTLSGGVIAVLYTRIADEDPFTGGRWRAYLRFVRPSLPRRRAAGADTSADR